MDTQLSRVLLAEDNRADARLLQEALAPVKSPRFQLTHVERLSEMRTHLREHTPDVVILDLGLPDSHDLETLVLTRAQAAEVPIVVLTGLEDEALAIQAMGEGAQDYLVKGRLDSGSLVRSLRYAIERKRAEEAVRRSEVEAARLTYLQESRRRIVAAQEQVRKEVAQELHGPVQTRLLLLQQRLQRAADAMAASSEDGAGELKELARELDEVRENQVRRISRRLHPGIISWAWRRRYARCGTRWRG